MSLTGSPNLGPIRSLNLLKEDLTNLYLLPNGPTNTVNLGSSSLKFKDGYFAGDLSVTGTLTAGTLAAAALTGDLVVTGTVESADAVTPVLSTASGKTNTGYLQLKGKTSGSLKILPADALAQIVTLDIAAQTSGACTLTIPDQAGVNSSFVFTTLAQTLTNKTLTAPVLGVATGTSLAVTGLITSSSPTAGIGYVTGAQGTAVVQQTNRSTGVTINGLTGKITTTADSIAAQTSVTFTVTNSAVALTDTVIVNIRSGSTGNKTIASVNTVAAGSFAITLFVTDASTADTGASIINFTVLKGADGV